MVCEATGWETPEDSNPQPSHCAQDLTQREVGFLCSVNEETDDMHGCYILYRRNVSHAVTFKSQCNLDCSPERKQTCITPWSQQPHYGHNPVFWKWTLINRFRFRFSLFCFLFTQNALHSPHCMHTHFCQAVAEEYLLVVKFRFCHQKQLITQWLKSE